MKDKLYVCSSCNKVWEMKTFLRASYDVNDNTETMKYKYFNHLTTVGKEIKECPRCAMNITKERYNQRNILKDDTGSKLFSFIKRDHDPLVNKWIIPTEEDFKCQ